MQNIQKKSLLILASESPRRRDLLAGAGLSFTVVPSSFDESSVLLSSPPKYVQILAECKAADVSNQYPDNWIIGADTIVLSDNDILGKPSSEKDAFRMLKLLSGNIHYVLTGYCICCKKRGYTFSETITTEVFFKDLTEKEICWYIDTKEPFGKAGAYAIQGLGSRFVKRINGSYTNVVGLPVCEVVASLSGLGKKFENQIKQH